MKLTDRQANRMLAIFHEFGPRRRIPVRERWAQVFPDATPDDMQEWETHCEEIEHFAYGLAERVRDEGLDEDVARAQISERVPHLSHESVAETYNKARYYAVM